jgi:PAS domain S-box-containing protein
LKSRPNLGSNPYDKPLSILLACIAASIGVCALIGWFFDVPILTQWHPLWVTMKVNTAIGVIIASLAAIGLHWIQSRATEQWLNAILLTLALTLSAIGLITLMEYLGFLNNFSIDQLIRVQPQATGDLSPAGRPSPVTAFIFLIDGIALICLKRGQFSHFFRLGQILALSGLIVGTLVLIGYIFGAADFYAAGRFTAVAPPTAFSIIFISLSLLFFIPFAGIMHIYTSQTPTGRLLRSASMLAFICPLLLGWLRLQGQLNGYYGLETGVAITVVGAIVVSEGVVWWLTAKLHEAYESIRQHAALLELVRDCIMVRDASDCIVYWNQGAARMFGYNADEAIGQKSLSLLQTTYPKPVQQIMTELHAVGFWEGELVHRAKDGKPISVSSRWSENRESLGKYKGVLEINNSIENLKQAQRRTSEFYATVSHELRTPVASIRAGLGIIEMSSDELSPKLQEVVKISTVECERMSSLINDLIDLSKIEAGVLTLHKSRVCADRLLRSCVDSVKFLAEEKHISIVSRCEVGLDLNCDFERVQQILINLLSNAIKYSQPSTEVTLTAAALEAGVRFEVKDAGKGIPLEFQEGLFSRFYQPYVHKRQGGGGLGLAISKALVETHKGEIGFDVEPGKGTTFWVNLPDLEVENGENSPG